MESLVYSLNTFFTFLDWEFELENTIKAKLATTTQTKIGKLVIVVSYRAIDSLRNDLEEGFLPGVMVNLMMLGIVIAQPFVLTEEQKHEWHSLLAQKLLPYLTSGLGDNTRVYVDANWETAAMDAVEDVLGPGRCCFQNMRVVGYLDIYQLEWLMVTVPFGPMLQRVINLEQDICTWEPGGGFRELSQT